MNALLLTLSSDPRAGLAAGLKDAGEAILNLERIASLPKPVGFFDPKNPSELPPAPPASDKKASASDGAKQPSAAEDEEKKPGEGDQRYPLMSFSSTDMAFAGDVLVAGSYHGFNILCCRRVWGMRARLAKDNSNSGASE